MAVVAISDSILTDIADAIRAKNGTANTYKPSEMPDAIEAISGGGITPTGTKEISITQNGTTTEDVTNYADAEITVNVSGGSTPARLMNHIEIVMETTATSTAKVSVALTPASSCEILVLIDQNPSSPDASQYIALMWTQAFYSAGAGSKLGDILRPAGTVGTDNAQCSFDKTTGILTLGGQYGHFLQGTKYHIYQFEIGGAS